MPFDTHWNPNQAQTTQETHQAVSYSDAERAHVQKTICAQLALGKSVKSILENTPGMPTRQTFYNWLMEDAEFFDNYTRAREAQADFFADEITEIADTETDPQKARNRIDARKWAAGKLKPKLYGDRLQIDGDLNVKLTDEQLDARLTKLLGKAGTAVAAGREGEAEEAA